jgi:hypothetical protein
VFSVSPFGPLKIFGSYNWGRYTLMGEKSKSFSLKFSEKFTVEEFRGRMTAKPLAASTLTQC